MSMYFIKNKASKKIKIGISNDVQKRMKQLQNASGDPLELLLSVNTEDDRYTEMKLHDLFVESRSLGEWFIPSKDIEAFIEGFNTCLENNKNYELNFKQKNSNPEFFAHIDSHSIKLLSIASKERGMSLTETASAMLQCAIDVYFATTNRKNMISCREEA